MMTIETITELVEVLNSNHFAAVVLIALFAIIKRPPPKD